MVVEAVVLNVRRKIGKRLRGLSVLRNTRRLKLTSEE
jgi:hypothetical protein